MQVPNGTGPGVRWSKRPMLASRTRCNVLWKPPKSGKKVKIGNKVQFGNKFANWCNVWSIECVIVYGHVPECHVTIGRGRRHNRFNLYVLTRSAKNVKQAKIPKRKIKVHGGIRTHDTLAVYEGTGFLLPGKHIRTTFTITCLFDKRRTARDESF